LLLLPSVCPLLGWPFYAFVAAAAGLLWYEHSIVRADDLWIKA